MRWPQYIGVASGLPAVRRTSRRTDFVRSARAQGIHGERVEHGSGVAGALERARTANEDGVPALVDVEIARDEYAPGFVAFHRDEWRVGT